MSIKFPFAQSKSTYTSIVLPNALTADCPKCHMELLYHATYNTRLQSIKEMGLGGIQLKNWMFSKDGVVYFAPSPYIAESYAEVAEDVSDDELASGIIILAVLKERLDISLLRIDENNLDNITFEYASIVPAENLFIWTECALWGLQAKP